MTGTPARIEFVGGSASKRPKWKPIILIALPLLIAAGFIAFMLHSFLQVKESRLIAGDQNLRDGIRVTANIVDVAPRDRVVKLQLAFVPIGSYAQRGEFLRQPVTVTVLGGADIVDDSYKASEVMLPADIRVPLRSGGVSMYPLDKYESSLRVAVTTADEKPIPTSMVVEASNPDYSLTMTSTSPPEDAARDVSIRVSRAPATIFFAMFISLLMLALTTLAIMTVYWLLRGGASESVRFIIPLLLVLLFAFPAIRGFAPGIPPLGVLMDFFAFFWCEIALGIGVVIVYAHLMREMRASTISAASSEADEEDPESDAEVTPRAATG